MLKVFLLTGVFMMTVSAFPLELSGEWRLRTGIDPLEKTAGEMFIQEAAAKFGTDFSGQQKSSPVVVIGTVKSCPAIAAEHEKRIFRFDPSKPESFHVVLRGRILYIVGATPKGAMNGAFRLLDRNRKDVDDVDFIGIPNFRYRVAGNECNQSPPPGWTLDDQARYYARHYINVVWGEKKRPPLPYDVRRKYGIGLMAEIRFPQGNMQNFWNDPANREAIFGVTKRPNLWVNPDGLKVISPFVPAGRDWYLSQYRKLLRENPDLRILYNMFSDYNILPDEKSFNYFTREPYTHSLEDTIIEILKIMREAVGRDSDIVPRAWLWQAFWFQRQRELAFMQRLTESGFGVMYNEAGNSDNWFFRLNNFDDVALKEAGKSESLILVSAGGACESVNPVIGMPLPRVAAHKIALLKNAGAEDFVLWWGSGEGWTYQPNLEVIAEMIWTQNWKPYTSKDFEDTLPILKKIALRDFGPELEAAVIHYWRKFDTALVSDLPLYRPHTTMAQGDPKKHGMHIYNWYQRLGTYTEPIFKGVFSEPITPALADDTRFKLLDWGADEYVIENYQSVISNLREVQREFAAVISAAPPGESRERMQQMHNWAQLAVLLWEAQCHHLQGRLAAKAAVNSGDMRRRLEPIVNESIRNTREILALLPHFAPNMNLTEQHEGVITNNGSIHKETEKLNRKLEAMQRYLETKE